MTEDNPQNWGLTSEKVDSQTLALYRNDLGDEIEVRDQYTKPVMLTKDPCDRYKVVYDPALSDDPWRVSYVSARREFGKAEEAFEYAVEILQGLDLDDSMVPDDMERILE